MEHFSDREIAGLKPELLGPLSQARKAAGVPFRITSGFRPGDPLTHGEGLAVDIACADSATRFRIVSSLLDAGFTRLGIYDHHIHADVGQAPRFPQRVIWWGTSR
jgi:zinc D-Ala-D-Ala carboxypeptidase